MFELWVTVLSNWALSNWVTALSNISVLTEMCITNQWILPLSVNILSKQVWVNPRTLVWVHLRVGGPVQVIMLEFEYKLNTTLLLIPNTLLITSPAISAASSSSCSINFCSIALALASSFSFLFNSCFSFVIFFSSLVTTFTSVLVFLPSSFPSFFTLGTRADGSSVFSSSSVGDLTSASGKLKLSIQYVRFNHLTL